MVSIAFAFLRRYPIYKRCKHQMIQGQIHRKYYLYTKRQWKAEVKILRVSLFWYILQYVELFNLIFLR